METGSQCCWAFLGYPEMSYMMDSSIDTGLCQNKIYTSTIKEKDARGQGSERALYIGGVAERKGRIM